MRDIEHIQSFVIAHAAPLQILLFATTLFSLWAAEAFFLREPTDKKWKHTSVNAVFILSALPIQFAFSIHLVRLADWVTVHHWGLFYLLPYHESFWVRIVLMYLVLDFLDYVYHVTVHNVPAFWRFHLVHHTDPVVDVSSNVREHPGETVIRNCFLLLWVFICGASFPILFIRQMTQTVSNILSHTALRLPPKAAKVIGWVFITPNIHHVHHHYRMPYTNCNYGDVFSVWDRLCGTFAELPEKETLFGLDTHMHFAQTYSYSETVSLLFSDPFKERLNYKGA